MVEWVQLHSAMVVLAKLVDVLLGQFVGFMVVVDASWFIRPLLDDPENESGNRACIEIPRYDIFDENAETVHQVWR